LPIYAHITGTGRFLPPDTLTNEDLSRMVDTSDEWISSRTGIRVRHIARGMSACDMGERAARNALEASGLSAADIGLVLVSTVTPDRPLPSLSCDLQRRLGLDGAFCFDVGAACSGFIYALDIAARYLQTGGATHALVVCTEKLSAITDFTDRRTCVLFGDGAGAAVLSASARPGGLLASCLAARGDEGAALRCDPGGYIQMDGQEVYKFAVRAMPEAMEKALAKAGRRMEELDFILPHQANLRIIQSVMARYGLPPEKMVINLERCGNTSSASIPIALDELRRANRLRPGALLLLAGFGAGLTYGAALFEWSV
jgi:3-oxoacyl-[acyl-carrier-protein] synthase-3